jgi:subtilase family serine protease
MDGPKTAIALWEINGEFPDAAVTNVTIPSNVTFRGLVVNFTVTVANFGNATGNFTTTLAYDNNTIGTQSVMNLAPNATMSLFFSWNTTNVPYRTFTITP